LINNININIILDWRGSEFVCLILKDLYLVKSIFRKSRFSSEQGFTISITAQSSSFRSVILALLKVAAPS